MKAVSVEITVPIVLAFEVEDDVVNDTAALLQAAKEAAQSAWLDGELEIQFDDDDNGITLVSFEVTTL